MGWTRPYSRPKNFWPSSPQNKATVSPSRTADQHARDDKEDPGDLEGGRDTSVRDEHVEEASKGLGDDELAGERRGQARSAVELLTGADPHRVKACPADEGCGWIFYDESKNSSRRWCSMRGCGSRAKLRRMYARKIASREHSRR